MNPVSGLAELQTASLSLPSIAMRCEMTVATAARAVSELVEASV
jgi:hypothetical protein